MGATQAKERFWQNGRPVIEMPDSMFGATLSDAIGEAKRDVAKCGYKYADGLHRYMVDDALLKYQLLNGVYSDFEKWRTSYAVGNICLLASNANDAAVRAAATTCLTEFLAWYSGGRKSRPTQIRNNTTVVNRAHLNLVVLEPDLESDLL